MDAEDYEVFVRGVGVGFTPERINIFYGLPPTIECYYAGLSPSEGDLEMIIAYLTDGTGSWKIRNGKRLNFKSSKLNGISKAWHYFISARLLPSNHLSEVTKDRAILNYCIQERKPIDVGSIIYDSVESTARSSTSVGLGFPSLIYSLCSSDGVSSDLSEEKLKSTKPIGQESISIYDRLRGKRSTAPSTSAHIPGSASTSRPSTSRPSISTSPPSSFWQTMDERYAEQENLSRLSHLRIDTLDAKFDHLSDYTQRKSVYDAEYDEALVRFLKGEQTVQFPTCPTFTPYDINQVRTDDYSDGADDDDDEATASDD